MINYTEDFNQSSFTKALAVHGKGNNVLILSKLNTPYTRFDGKRVSYQLNYRWLSESCKKPKDEVWACVQGDENTYWSKRELIESGVMDKSGKLKDTVNLFDCFSLL